MIFQSKTKDFLTSPKRQGCMLVRNNDIYGVQLQTQDLYKILIIMLTLTILYSILQIK